MKKTSITSAVILLFAFCWQAGEIRPQQQQQQQQVKSPEMRAASLTGDQWREDLKYLARELPRRHENAFHTVSKEQFEKAVAELDAAIPNLREDEILVGIRRIIALVGDAHTDLEPPKTFNRYPLTLSWFGTDLRVLRTSPEYRRALGARVAGIGALSLAEAVARVNTLIPAENEQFLRFRSPGLLNLAEVLHALKISPDLKRANWTFEDAQGKRFSLDVEAVAPDAKIEWLSTLKTVPLNRRRSDELMWATALPEDAQTVYLNLKSYPDAATFKRVSAETFRLIDENKAKRLIIDVRQSNGGDFIKFRSHLLRELKSRPNFRQPNSLFMLIGRGTISAAMVNSIEMRKELGAILVGEPSGSKPNNYSENDELTLPNSRLRVAYSTKYYKFQEKDTPALVPDKLIEPVWEIYTAGRDAAMEWILAQPLPK
ncbi:MAG: hypothetical protein M3384_05260 [Acidobacteriota bacterium]|nr:hypothetical protein [Acidobacteriota bacterium]